MMKAIILKSLIILLILTFTLPNLFGQRCSKKLLCDIEMDESYDYRGQSSYAILYPGDTTRTKIVIYAGQLYDIFVCPEPILGAVEFNVIKQTREYRNVPEEITENEEIIYKQDEYGAFEYDEYGDYIEIGRNTVLDTIWVRKKFIEEEIIFNNLNNKDGVKRWQTIARNTETLIIEVIIPDNAGSEGCADLMIGQKSKQRSTFTR